MARWTLSIKESVRMATVHQLKPGATPKLRVLVVEDNLDSVHSMAMLVKMMGHEVQFAGDEVLLLDGNARDSPHST